MILVTRQLHAGNPLLVDKRSDDSTEFNYVVAQTVGTFLGLLAIGFTVAAVLSERLRRVRADDERRFTSDASILGCFHSRPVSWVVFPWLRISWLRSLWLRYVSPRSPWFQFSWPRSSWLGSLWGQRTEVLKLPSITGLIEIGDCGGWTSNTLDLMAESHSEQTWVNLYESVVTSVVSNASLVEEVWKDEAWKDEKPIPAILKRIGETHHREHHIPSMWKDRQSAYEDQKLSNLYRELSLGTAMRLPPQKNLTNDSKRKRGLIRLTPTWIVRDKACIGVTREELAALALVMGVAFSRLGNSLYLSGVGAFGLSLNISHSETDWLISLVQGSRIPRHVASIGSGYTTLMAKHLACGSVPFAQSKFWVWSVYVTDDVYNAIKAGGDIVDKQAFGGDSLEFLRRLPAEKTIDAYYGTQPPTGIKNQAGLIFRADGTTEVGTWPRAVRGIAFGGLVPQANPNVVWAVTFTVAGSKTKMHGCIENLEHLIDQLQDLAPKEDKWLFGENVRTRHQYKEDTLINYTFPSKDSNPPDAAAIFARYSNLLERVVALTLGSTTATSQAPTANGSSPRPPVVIKDVSKEDILEAAASEIQKAYEAAVDIEKRYSASEEAKEAAREDLGALLRGVIDRVKDPKNHNTATNQPVIKLEDCAIIIRCVLAAWAFTVPLIQVKQAAREDSPPNHAPSGETKVPHEMVLANLPPVSAFR